MVDINFPEFDDHTVVMLEKVLVHRDYMLKVFINKGYETCNSHMAQEKIVCSNNMYLPHIFLPKYTQYTYMHIYMRV